jgi:hypothetical protein
MDDHGAASRIESAWALLNHRWIPIASAGGRGKKERSIENAGNEGDAGQRGEVKVEGMNE